MALAQPATFANVATSDSYGMTLGIIDVGGGTSESASYIMLGKARDLYVTYKPSSGYSYRMGEGFLRAIFYSPVFPPIATGISPAYSYNDRRITLTITGQNFRTTGVTSVELRLAGETTIVATEISVSPDGTTITCTVDLRGVAADPNWEVYVYNDGYVVDMVPPSNYFDIRPAELKIIGPALNYPNPFNPDKEPTFIKYTLTRDADISLVLYNIIGERILYRQFPAGTEGGRAGENTVQWNGHDVFDALVPNNVYICKIITKNGKVLATIKIAVLR